ncbi:hypothetical protein GCM10009086_21860 [Pseudomonas rhodesiae]
MAWAPADTHVACTTQATKNREKRCIFMLHPGGAAPERRARASRHDVADRCLANGGDEEIRHAVPGEVDRQSTQVGA